MHIFIVQHIDLDVGGMRYIKIDIIIEIVGGLKILRVFTDNKHRIILHVCFLYVNLFCMHIFIVQHIDLDVGRMRYIKINIIIEIVGGLTSQLKLY